jgi:peptidoglycan/LPS O-acetylase OafA/YrhL
MPPYWASLGLILIVAVVTKLATGTNDVAVLPRSFAGITATGLLLTEPLSRIPAMSGVYWSLSCEIVFYALMALLLFLPRLQRIPAAAILHVILCLAGLFNPPLDGWFRPLTLWPLFGTGLALALLPRAPRWAATMILFSVAQAFAHIAHHQLIEYSLTAAATAVCLVIVLRWPGIVWPRWLVWIGGISYSVYIVHATIAGPVFGRILHRQMELPLVELLRQGFVVVGTLVICGIFHLCFERPWMHRRPNFPLT